MEKKEVVNKGKTKGGSINLHLNDAAREKIEADTQEFLANKGVVDVIDGPTQSKGGGKL